MKKGAGYALAAALLFGMGTPLAKMLPGSVHPLMLAGPRRAGGWGRCC